MNIGSGDVKYILMGKNTKGYQTFFSEFCDFKIDRKAKRNPFGSKIAQFTAGAILEDRYYQILPEGYFPQYKVVSREMDVLSSTLDFALIDNGKLVDFDELKTCYSTDFLNFQEYKDAEYDTYINFIKKEYKHNYEQVQQQLYTSELKECNLVYLEVQYYDDDINRSRIIREDEYIKFRIRRDDEVINKIRGRSGIFQTIKDYFKN